jgi:hypothetical protein
MSMFNRPTRNIIFVRHGVHKGEFLVEVAREKDMRVFLGLPDKTVHRVPNEDVEKGLKKKVLLVVEKLPRSVYNVCLKEYQLIQSEQRSEHNNRRESSLLQSI